MGLGELTRQASSFLRNKYQTAKLFLNNVTVAESLAEEATNSDPLGPDARTMMRISEAAFDIDEYWRIVDVLHRRLYRVDWKEWRQSYKALALVEFLLTHGPEDIGEHFECDLDVVRELGTFEHVDERGFDWGSSTQKKSETVLKLITNERFLREARWKALKVSKEIQGFGNPSSASSPTSSSSKTSRSSSFGSCSGSSSSALPNELVSPRGSPRGQHERSLQELARGLTTLHVVDEEVESPHVWDAPAIETGSFLDAVGGGEGDELSAGGRTRGFSFRSFSNAGKVTKKKVDRQLSSAF